MAISDVARTELAKTTVKIVKRLEIIYELMDADLRQIVDVSRFVLTYGSIGGDSTIKAKGWSKPKNSPSLQIDDSFFLLPGHPDSVWEGFGAGVTPDQCHVRFTAFVPLPDGTLESIRTWIGRIVDAPVRSSGDVYSIDFSTEHPSAEALDAGITKESAGDRLGKLGSTW